jgi:hypothetical protein
VDEQGFALMKRTGTLKERFLSRTRGEGDCWIWISTKGGSDRAYGLFSQGRRGSTVYAHRWSYEHFVGAIPDGYDIDHLCRNRACVNPAHLEAVPHRENMLRGDTFAAANAGKTHCASGHPFDEANTYVTRTGSRSCRRCHAACERARRRAARATLAAIVAALLIPQAASSHNVPGTLHNRTHAVHWAFCGKQTKSPCGLGYQAVRVAKCESGWSLSVYAGNGQYLGMFQFGSFARSAYGFGWSPWAQSAAAYRYYQAAGWSPWSCAQIVGLR